MAFQVFFTIKFSSHYLSKVDAHRKEKVPVSFRLRYFENYTFKFLKSLLMDFFCRILFELNFNFNVLWVVQSNNCDKTRYFVGMVFYVYFFILFKREKDQAGSERWIESADCSKWKFRNILNWLFLAPKRECRKCISTKL